MGLFDSAVAMAKGGAKPGIDTSIPSAGIDLSTVMKRAAESQSEIQINRAYVAATDESGKIKTQERIAAFLSLPANSKPAVISQVLVNENNPNVALGMLNDEATFRGKADKQLEADHKAVTSTRKEALDALTLVTQGTLGNPKADRAAEIQQIDREAAVALRDKLGYPSN